jgi:hypothetical protein
VIVLTSNDAWIRRRAFDNLRQSYGNLRPAVVENRQFRAVSVENFFQRGSFYQCRTLRESNAISDIYSGVFTGRNVYLR